MTDERAMEILDPDHREHYESIEPINEACRIGIAAIKRTKELEAENAELRATLSKMETVEARLEKAVELPRIIHPNTYEWFVQYQNEYGLIFDEIFYSERAAEARLKKKKEKNNE